jgi:hypothetical protein
MVRTLMTMTSPMSATPVATVDVLNSLLDAETTSVFRFMGEGYPYLSRATAEVKRPLEAMVRTIEPRVLRLADTIERLGGVPTTTPRGIDREEQYLAFLSLKFLLPKLVDAKKLLIERYENAITALKGADREVLATVQDLLAEHKAQLAVLNRSAEHVAGGG